LSLHGGHSEPHKIYITSARKSGVLNTVVNQLCIIGKSCAVFSYAWVLVSGRRELWITFVVTVVGLRKERFASRPSLHFDALPLHPVQITSSFVSFPTHPADKWLHLLLMLWGCGRGSEGCNR
jgi:hypothetical protein